jgi:hypothetical protein
VPPHCWYWAATPVEVAGVEAVLVVAEVALVVAVAEVGFAIVVMVVDVIFEVEEEPTVEVGWAPPAPPE